MKTELDSILLKDVLASPLSAIEVVQVGIGCLSALESIHHAGSLHLNLTTSNVILPPGEKFKNIRLSGVRTAARLPGRIDDLPAETVRYLAPEQTGLIDKPLSEATDLYALGVILLECIYGRNPFLGLSTQELLRRSLIHDVPDPRRAGVRIPRALSELVARLVQKDPSHRYQTAAGVLADLTAVEGDLLNGERHPAVVIGRHDRRRTLTESGFVGLSKELAQLEEALHRAQTGDGQLSLIEGEPGSGKTTLLDELHICAQQEALRVIRCRANERAGQQPFEILQGVGRYLVTLQRDEPEAFEATGERFQRDWSSVYDFFPELEATLKPSKRVDRGQPVEAYAENRGVDSLISLLDALGDETRPAVVILDDLQWADSLSARLIAAWSCTSKRRFVMLVGASRTNETDGTSFSVKSCDAQCIALGRLGPHDVEQMAESMAGPLPDAAREAIIRLSGGNPFMVSAVLRGMVETGALRWVDPTGWRFVPEGLRDVRTPVQATALLSRRLKLLPEVTLTLLSNAAILGREFDLDLLSRIARTDRESASAGLRAAEERHLVWCPGDSEMRSFVHDKIRDDILATMSEEKKREMHLRIASLLEPESVGRAFGIAYHFDAAGVPERALPFALKAGTEARVRHDLQLAAEYFRIARRGSFAEPREIHFHIARELGEILLLLGAYEESALELRRALDLTEDPIKRAAISSLLAETAQKRGRLEESEKLIEEALRSLGEKVPVAGGTYLVRALVCEFAAQAAHILLPSRFVGRKGKPTERDLVVMQLYARLTFSYYFRKPLPLLWSHLRLMNLAESFAASQELAIAWASHSVILSAIPLLGRALRYSHKAEELSRALGDDWVYGRVLHYRGAILYVASKFDEALKVSRQAMEVLARTGDKWEYNDAWVVEGLVLLKQGNLAQARKGGRAVFRAAASIQDSHSAGFGLEIAARASGGAIGREQAQGELARTGGDIMTTSVVAEAEALRLLREDRLDEAIALLSETVDKLKRARFLVDYVAQISLFLAEALRRKIDCIPTWEQNARAGLRRAQRMAVNDGLRAAKRFKNSFPHALREAAFLAASEGNGRKARKLLKRSIADADQLKMRHERALSLYADGKIGMDLRWSDAVSKLELGRSELVAVEAEFDLLDRDQLAHPILSVSLSRRSMAVAEWGERIASAVSPQEALDNFEKAVTELIRADVYRIDHVDTLTRLPSEWVAKARESGGVFIVSETELENLEAGEPLAGCRSGLVMVLTSQGQAVSAFVGNRRVAELYGDEDLRIAQLLAAITTAALNVAEGVVRTREEARLRDEFLQAASHELKTPLTALRLQVGLLKTAQARRAPASEMIEGAERQIQRMTELVEQLLRVSAFEKGLRLNRQALRLDELVRKVVQQAWAKADARGSSIKVIMETGDYSGRWDLALIENVIVALLDNALKFGAGGQVTIAMSSLPDKAVLKVADQGIGIDVKNHQRIFERYEKAVPICNFGGLGLGLYLSRKIIEAHGGTIRIESALEAGAVFTVELPRQYELES